MRLCRVLLKGNDKLSRIGILQKIMHKAWLVKMSMRERMRWRKKTSGFLPDIRVYYGQDHIPLPDEPASGGIIKCQDLQHTFPNDPVRPNLLYLVSSTLPPHLYVMIAAAKRAGASIVLNQNGVAYPAWHGEGWEDANQPLALAHSSADYIFYQSKFCQESASHFLGKTHCPTEVLHNPVDTSIFTPVTSGINSIAPVFLTAGSHHSFYRVKAAVDTLSFLRQDYPSARLIIAGKFRWGKSEEIAGYEIRQYVDGCNLGDRVEWFGVYNQRQAPDLFRRADILLHANYNDPCPRLVVEAMACGLPVVYSASGGVPELVGDTAGIGIPTSNNWNIEYPPSAQALAEAVRRIMRDYRVLSEKARERAVANLDVGPWLQRHREVFGLLVEKTCPS